MRWNPPPPGGEDDNDSLYTSAVDYGVVDRVRDVARRARRAGALTRLLYRPGVTAPIVGATKLGHLEDALAAEEQHLSADEMGRLEELYISHEVSGHR